MNVYVEYALAENFCMDFVLLYAAKCVTKNRAGMGRICIASSLGAAFAVVFPLLGLNGFAAAAVKLVFGAAMCLVAGRFSRDASCFAYIGDFAAFTFALGGALVALFSLTGTEYAEGGGVLISRVPVGIPLFFALALLVAARRVASRFTKYNSKISVVCHIYAGKYHVSVPAFFDSGNRVYRFGSPVSVLPRAAAKQLVDVARINTFVSVHTVAGDKKLPVFVADKVKIDCGKKVITLRGVEFCIGGAHRAVLHPDLAEVCLC